MTMDPKEKTLYVIRYLISKALDEKILPRNRNFWTS